MPIPVDVNRMLLTAPHRTPLRVTHILFETTRDRCAEHGLRVGDEITCLALTPRHLLLDHPEHGPVRLGIGLAVCVEVEAVRRTPATEERALRARAGSRAPGPRWHRPDHISAR